MNSFQRSLIWRAALSWLTALLFASSAMAQDPVFDAAGFDTHRATFSQLPFEHIDPLTGNLILTFTDLVLPGNAGFDLKIQRTYNSKIYKEYPASEMPREDGWAGVGWTLHFGRVFNWRPQDSGGPIIEMPDGSRHPTFLHASAPNGCSWCFITREYWIYDKNSSTLTLPNGTKYTFGHTGTAGYPYTATALYATHIVDPFGNAVDVSYLNDPSDAISSITQSVGSQTRSITFSTNSTLKSLATMTFQGRTWNYTQINDGLVNGLNWLTAVQPPTGPGWSFSYKTSGPAYSELIRLTTPSGGQIDYQYADQLQYIGLPVAVHSMSLTNRTVSGRDVTSGSWTYAYAQGSAKNQTVITGACSDTVTHTFLGVGNYSSSGSAWAVGLPSNTSIASGGSTLQTEQWTWTPSVDISPDTQTLGWNQDVGIKVPLLSSRTVTRGSVALTTTNSYASSNFNNYGRPSQISESGQLSRTTSRSFQYGFSGYIVDKIASATVSGGGDTFTTNYTYNSATGFMTSRNDYGVTTSYQPTAYGNISRETNARGYNTDFTYDWGSVASIATPEYSITRSINSDGTIASETRRGFQTTFTYDSLMRLLTTNPPAGNNIVRSYASSGETETVTRGSSSTVTTLDGFGRPSATLNNVGVRTAISFDACGRRTYESYPYATSNIGTSFQYDALGRVTRRTHPDAAFQTFAYSNGIDVTVTDENGRTTVQDWSAFGDPDDKRLISVTDAASQVTSYSYNILGSLRTVSGMPGSREWSYNSKNQLISETHPENGITQYGRDAVGNMSSRTDGKGQFASFSYDGNNRLTAVDQPGSVYDVSIAYDASDNRTAMANNFASSTLTYDGANRLASRMDVIAGRTFTTDYTYDGNDNVATIQYPSARSVAYGYDAENRVTSVTNGSGTTYANNFSYHPSGQIASYTAGNNLVHARSLDSRYRVSSLSAGGALSLGYGYDNVGNVTSIDDSRVGFDQGFAYDQLDRLTSHSGWNAANYGYDALGNRTSKSGPGAATAYSYNPSTNRLSQATGAQAESFGHDANGSLTSDGAGSYTYTPDNMLETASISGVTTIYRYDGDNQRALKILSGSSRYFVHGPGGALLSEFEEVCAQIGPSRDYIFAGSQLIASVRFPSVGATAAVTTTASSLGEYLFNVSPPATANIAVSITTNTGAPVACQVAVQYATANGSATAGADYSATSGTLTFNVGSVSGSTQTISVPMIHDTLDEDDESFNVNLTSASGASLGAATHVVTIIDDDAPPMISVSDVSVNEGDSSTSGLFTVSLSTASGRILSVDYITGNGTAVAGTDYTTTAGSVSFDAGTTSRTVSVPIIGDTIEESATETFTLNLSNAVNVTIADGSGTGLIVDDDAPVSASIGDAGVTEGNSGTTSASFVVTLAAPSGRTVTINYATANGTAVAGRDFTNTSGIVTFTPGSTSQPISVPVLGDAMVENSETFNVSLSNPVWASLADAQGIGTILNDDAFTDDPLSAGVTAVRVVHLTELRSQIDLLRLAYGLGAFSWTDATIVSGQTPVKGLHLTEMRSALNAVYQAAFLTPPTYTDPEITPGVILIRAVHVNELRAAIKAVP